MSDNYIICGLPNSGQVELYQLLKQSLAEDYHFNKIGTSILETKFTQKSITLNLFDLTRIATELDDTFKFIICVRDIRNILCDKFIFNGSESYVTNWNYRYMIENSFGSNSNDISITSFGLRYYYNYINSIPVELLKNCIFISYDKLISDPIMCQLELMEFNDYNLTFISDFKVDAIDLVEDSDWTTNITRIEEQINKFPDIMECVIDINSDWHHGIYDEEKAKQYKHERLTELAELPNLKQQFSNNNSLKNQRIARRNNRPLRNQSIAPRKINNRRKLPNKLIIT